MVTSEFQGNIEETTQLHLQFDKRGGILPVIVQEFDSGQILMLGYLNEEAFEITIKTGIATFWSTSRKELWVKGKQSGNYLILKNVLVDCDQDAVIYQVELKGDGVCHTFGEDGSHRKACFYRSYDKKENTLKFINGMK